MKICKIMSALLLLSSVMQARELVNTIKAVVYGEDKEDIALITLVEITRPGIDGAVHTLEDKIFSKLLWFEGKKYRILPSEEDMERNLKIVEKDNNISRKQLIDMFAASGYTFEEGKEQFSEMYTVNSCIDFKVRSGLFVSHKEVQAYYDENPEYVDATYTLQRGLVSYNYAQSTQEQARSITDAIARKKTVPGVVWSPSFTIKQDQLAADKAYVRTMKEGDISAPIATAEGFELFKVVTIMPRRLKTLDERYAQIADMLRRPKYQEILSNYKKQLYDNASIIYF